MFCYTSTMEALIRPAIPDDAPAIYAVQRQGWIDTYPNQDLGITTEDITERIEGKEGSLISEKIERWRKNIAKNAGRFFVATKSDKVVGYILMFHDENTNRTFLGSLYVLPEVQGQGVGSLLLNETLSRLPADEDIYLHVVSYNENAIKFYEKHGFVKTGKDAPISVAALPSGIHLPEIEMVFSR